MNNKLYRRSAIVGIALLLSAPAHSVPAADTGKLAEPCAACHGKDGASAESSVPTIGGYSSAYIVDSMTSYKKKERPCPEAKYLTGDKKGRKTDMCKVAGELNDADTRAVAEYFAGKKFIRAKQPFDADKAKRGKGVHDTLCAKCHEKGGSSPDDDSGILAGQWTPYLKHQFADYAAGKRPMEDKMKVKMDKLGKDDVDLLLHYFASFQ